MYKFHILSIPSELNHPLDQSSGDQNQSIFLTNELFPSLVGGLKAHDDKNNNKTILNARVFYVSQQSKYIDKLIAARPSWAAVPAVAVVGANLFT